MLPGIFESDLSVGFLQSVEMSKTENPSAGFAIGLLLSGLWSPPRSCRAGLTLSDSQGSIIAEAVSHWVGTGCVGSLTSTTTVPGLASDGPPSGDRVPCAKWRWSK